MPEISRRRFMAATATLPLAALLPKRFLREAFAGAQAYRFFDAHQADLVIEATARLIPGPDDDPLEIGHPGAREANVVRYIDLMLGAFAVDPPHLFAGGPWSDRNGSAVNHLMSFVPLSALQEQTWRRRIAALQEVYRDGISSLDDAAGGDFLSLPAVRKDLVLGQDREFTPVLFTHAIEGFLSNPEYGGNAGGVGWQEISFSGDTQPRGYTDAEVSESDGLDPVVPDVIVAAAVEHFDAMARAMAARWRRGR